MKKGFAGRSTGTRPPDQWWKKIKTGEYLDYYKRMYENRRLMKKISATLTFVIAKVLGP